MSTTKVTLSLKALEAKVRELDEIREQVKAHAGTQAARLKAARDEAIASGSVKVPVLNVKASSSVADAEQAVADWQATLAQRIDEAVTGIMAKSKAKAGTEITALRETFKAKAEQANALRTILVASGVAGADAVTIPTVGNGGGGGTKSAKVSNAQWYIIRANGTRKDMTETQNKPSSVAWYHGAEIGAPATGNGGKGCSKDEMFSFLKAAGADVKAGEAWSFTTSTGVTVGMDVTETE